MSYILLTEKEWHYSLFEFLKSKNNNEWVLVDNKNDLNIEYLQEIEPDKIFIPHWSHIIPANIYNNFECIVFHMTDLPYGRGGSPLQNLIVRGHKETKISALRVNEGIDTGDIYLKKDLSLHGTAQEIFLRATKVIYSMIEEILVQEIKPYKQEGEVVRFSRRKPEDGDMIELKDIERVYDYIRMLDAEGYPNAYFSIGNFKLEFSRATIKDNKTLLADVRITQK